MYDGPTSPEPAYKQKKLATAPPASGDDLCGQGRRFSCSGSTRVAKDFYIRSCRPVVIGQGLARCSLAARGAWIDMLCMMFQCDEVGVLVSAGVPWTVEDVCAALGGQQTSPVRASKNCWRGVAARDNRNAIFSRRMVYEANLSRQRAEAGSIGGRRAQRFCLSKNPEQTSSKPQAKCRAKPCYRLNSDSESGFTLSGEICAREKSKLPTFRRNSRRRASSLRADYWPCPGKREESTPTRRAMLKNSRRWAGIGRSRPRYSVENGGSGYSSRGRTTMAKRLDVQALREALPGIEELRRSRRSPPKRPVRGLHVPPRPCRHPNRRGGKSSRHASAGRRRRRRPRSGVLTSNRRSRCQRTSRRAPEGHLLTPRPIRLRP